MKKKLLTLLLSSMMVFGLSAQASAATLTSNGNPTNTVVSPQVIGDYYMWKITNTSGAYTSYGSFVLGTMSSYPAPTDNSNLSFSITNTVSVEVSGTIEVAKSDITASTGYTVGSSWSATAGYTMGLSKGQKGEIDYRNVYDTKDVTQTEYIKDGTIWDTTGNVQVVKVKKWKAYDYYAHLI